MSCALEVAYLCRELMSREGNLAVGGSAHCRTKSDCLLSTFKLEVCPMFTIALHKNSHT